MNFNEEFPEESKILMEIYQKPPRFNCPRGHEHYFNFMHFLADGSIMITPLRECGKENQKFTIEKYE